VENGHEFVDPQDLTSEQLGALRQQRELSPAEKAEVLALYEKQVTLADLQQYADWEKATPLEDFLRELKEEQQNVG
jgi:hypothetical protein